MKTKAVKFHRFNKLINNVYFIVFFVGLFTSTAFAQTCDDIPVISGPTSVCNGVSNILYKVNKTANSTYTWVITGNATSTIPLNRDSIVINAVGSYQLEITKTYPSCPSQSATLSVSEVSDLSLNAGTDQYICNNNNSILINAQIDGTPNLLWQTLSNGTFSNPVLANTSYTLSNDELTKDSIKLYATSTNNGACTEKVDTITVYISKLPFVEAGLNQSYCENNIQKKITVSGTVINSSNFVWSTSGQGDFDANNLLSTQYNLRDNDSLPGNFTLTLKTISDGVCPEVNDFITVTINNKPTIFWQDDFVICETNLFPTLTFFYSNINSAQVSSLTGGNLSGIFNSNNVEYYTTPSEIENGFAKAIVIGERLQCKPVRDTITLQIKKRPIINAGTNITSCINSSTVSLNGDALYANAFEWTTNGSGTFSSSTNLSTEYTFTTNDKGISLVFTLSSKDASPCGFISDNLNINFKKLPTIDIGADKEICTGIDIPLKGDITDATSIDWTSSGTGTFSNTTGLQTKYIPSSNDYTAGNLTITGTTTDIVNCTPASDDLIISFVNKVSLTASEDQVICKEDKVNLTSSLIGANGVQWSTSGGGTFDEPNSLTPTYSPSPGDKFYADIELYVTSTEQGTCEAAKDTVKLLIKDCLNPTTVAHQNNKLTIYPNPSNDIVNINLSGKPIEKITIKTLEGKVLEESFNSQNISTHNIKNGIYMIEVKSRESIYNKKLIIKH